VASPWPPSPFSTREDCTASTRAPPENLLHSRVANACRQEVIQQTSRLSGLRKVRNGEIPDINSVNS
jgi:hypothetical protein